MIRPVKQSMRRARTICAPPQQVADGVWAMRGGLPVRGFNTYFLRDGDGVALYDTGIREMGTALAAAGAVLGGITRVVLGHAHADHRGGAAALRGIPVLCHSDERADAEGDAGLHYLNFSRLPPPARWVWGSLTQRWDGGPVQIDETVEEGEEVAGFEVVHLPGHAPGQIGLWRASDRVAIGGDSFFMFDPPRLRALSSPMAPPSAFNQDDDVARESMCKLAALAPAVALPAHGRPLRGDVRGALERAAG